MSGVLTAEFDFGGETKGSRASRKPGSTTRGHIENRDSNVGLPPPSTIEQMRHLLDNDVFLAAIYRGHVAHTRARAWLDAAMPSHGAWLANPPPLLLLSPFAT